MQTTDYSHERILLLRRILNWVMEQNNPTLNVVEIEQYAEMSSWEIQHLFNQYLRIEVLRFLNNLNKQSYGNQANQQLSIFEIPEIIRSDQKPNFQFDVSISSIENSVQNKPIYYSIEQTILGELFIASVDQKICQCTFEETENGFNRLKKSNPKTDLISKKQYIHDQVARLLDNEQLSFPLELAAKGTAFQIQVWQYLTQIQSGDTTTYGEIAHQFGDAKLARAIGTAVGANPIAILIPCHRVIAQTGTVGKFRWGTDLKRILLAVEH